MTDGRRFRRYATLGETRTRPDPTALLIAMLVLTVLLASPWWLSPVPAVLLIVAAAAGTVAVGATSRRTIVPTRWS
ncbi:hypothetical protein [Rhodococcus sp. SJ]|uniref:hypothetical protein n=1 Tax=Rhodococcus sp. SJ TaxID=3434112 RepID=UPI003D78DFEC